MYKVKKEYLGQTLRVMDGRGNTTKYDLYLITQQEIDYLIKNHSLWNYFEEIPNKDGQNPSFKDAKLEIDKKLSSNGIKTSYLDMK